MHLARIHICVFISFIHPEDALRVDANISVRPTGTNELGIRTEVKNIQSWKSLSKAIGTKYIRYYVYFNGVVQNTFTISIVTL